MRTLIRIVGYIFAIFVIFVTLDHPTKLRARVENAWSVDDYQSDIIVNTDASLYIKETIKASCPGCIDKHGIFRVLPLQYTNDHRKHISSPLELQSITDETGKPYPFTTKNNTFNHTLMWKIGDPNIDVTGDHTYVIIYRVKNAVRSANPQFDELYWNLSGNFWDIPIDHFTAHITFPKPIAQSNTRINLYSGTQGTKTNTFGSSVWTDPQVLTVSSTDILEPRNGITLSTTFPKGIITPYIPGFREQYADYAFLMLPILAFMGMCMLWIRYGKDPKIHAGVVPEFGAPDNLTPMQISMIMTNGSLRKEAITAEIVNLAVQGIIKITQIPKKGIFGKEDYELEKLRDDPQLTLSQKDLVDRLFILKVHNKIKLSSLVDSFYNDVSKIEDTLHSELFPKKLVPENQSAWFVWILVIVFGSIFAFSGSFMSLFIYGFDIRAISIIVTLVILIGFLCIMPKRSTENVTMLFKIKGFRYYMETAEKYRQKFNEKENIFERFLPYAILFGLTGLWVQKMRDIYGEKYIAAYHPIWYSGGNFSSFNVTSFTTSMNSISSAVSSASSAPSSSGSGGGGFSDGGGGGGGGGGW
ncbi:hypothetical protein AUK41_02115 [Candidatus Berkelbacteria bacterium CG2_30_43_20]|nr:MAG: hypothetical protein AUK41_02115 [Candidatus Berkelbacteria bacterium CG2_30_43_20]